MRQAEGLHLLRACTKSGHKGVAHNATPKSHPYVAKTTLATAASRSLHLGCFAHGLEDRSSPIHSFGGFGARRSAVEQRLNTTAICQHHIGSPICDLIFWGADDHADVYGVPGYVPLATPMEA